MKKEISWFFYGLFLAVGITVILVMTAIRPQGGIIIYFDITPWEFIMPLWKIVLYFLAGFAAYNLYQRARKELQDAYEKKTDSTPFAFIAYFVSLTNIVIGSIIFAFGVIGIINIFKIGIIFSYLIPFLYFLCLGVIGLYVIIKSFIYTQ